jgi:hypothetical protein
LILPSTFLHLEHLVLLRKLPSPLCCNTSSKNTAWNEVHSFSQSWCLIRIHCT